MSTVGVVLAMVSYNRLQAKCQHGEVSRTASLRSSGTEDSNIQGESTRWPQVNPRPKIVTQGRRCTSEKLAPTISPNLAVNTILQ